MKKLLTVIELLLIFVVLVCGVFLGLYRWQGYKTETEVDELREQIPDEPDEAKTADDGVFAAYYDLYKQNSDFAGWINVPNTNIDYPVMQTADNEFYLHRSFDKDYRYSGMPFADYQCDMYTPSTNIIIYAHNMKDGSMFATLSRYEDKDFYERNKVISFNTLYAKGNYEVIGAFHTTPSRFAYHEFIDCDSMKEFDAFIAGVKERSMYNTESSASYGDKLLTLSTCAYGTDNDRFVVVAKKIN